MASFSDRFCKILELRQISAAELSRKTGINESVLSQYKKGDYEPKQRRLELLSKTLNVSIPWLMGADVPMNDRTLYPPDISTDNVEFPVIGEVAAGFDKIAVEEWSGDKIKIPVEFLKGKNSDDYFVLKITGDSMYPLYIDGDNILVKKQDYVDYNGQVAVLIYGDDCGTVKKVEHKKNSICLVPINPQYQQETITGVDIERVHILGIPKLLVRDLDEDYI